MGPDYKFDQNEMLSRLHIDYFRVPLLASCQDVPGIMALGFLSE